MRHQPLALAALLGTWTASGALAAQWVLSQQAPRQRSEHAMAYDAIRDRLVLHGGTQNGWETWELDGTSWRLMPRAPAALGERRGHVMAFAANRGQVVLFGGMAASGRKNDTWEWDGSAWRPGPAAPAGLTPRYGSAACYLAASGRVLLFGGADTAYKGDSWLYDGVAWTAGPAGPPARALHAMAYDATRSRAVMFGGGNATVLFDDTWEYDGAAWSAGPAPPAALTPRWGIAMAHDAAAGRIILSGGASATSPAHSQTWEYDGLSWTAGQTAPNLLWRRRSHAMAWMASLGGSVVFGGNYGGCCDKNDTWRYAAGAWSEPAGIPMDLWARSGHAVANDAARGRLVLFGGGDTTVRDDTWEFDGTAWSAGPPPGSGPSFRSGHAMAYDAVRSRVVLFGGGSSPYLGDTWEFDGTAWVLGPAAPVGLTGRFGHSLSFDATRGLAVLFGGYDGVPRNDTWEYDGAGWVAGPAAPAGLVGRSSHGAAFDTARAITVIFGGYDGAERNDTWEYDGAAWSPGPPAPLGLAPRKQCAMAYDESLGRTVLFGGGAGTSGRFGDTWEYDGTSWTPGATAPAELRPRFGSAATFSSSMGHLVLFGGWDYLDWGNDTWLYVDCPAITVTPAALPGGAVGQPYSQMLAASGGAAPHSFEVSAGALPAGLVLTGTGLLSGAPSVPGTSAFTIAATDDDGCRGSESYQVSICGAIAIGPASLPGGLVGQPYSQTLTASGSIAPYTFTVTGGGLPPGLALAATGDVAGVPTTAGAWSFQVTAVDALGCSGSRGYTIAVGLLSSYVAGAGLGPSSPNRVRLFPAAGGTASVDFLAYQAGAWGVNVASATLTGAADQQVLAGPGPGDAFGPQVRGFSRSGTAMGKVNFYAYGTLKFGVNVAGERLQGGLHHEILTGPGPGVVFGPHVRGFDFDNTALSPIAKINFFAYGTLRYGVNVTGGDLDRDGYAELVTGPGPGSVFQPQLRGFNYDGTGLASMGKINFNAFSALQYGANVASEDVEGDGFGEIAAAPGPGPGAAFPAQFRGFDFDAAAIAPAPGFDVVGFTATAYGGRIGLGDLDADGRAELHGGAGRDPSADSTVKSWAYTGTALALLPVAFQAFPGLTYGVNVTSGSYGY